MIKNKYNVNVLNNDNKSIAQTLIIDDIIICNHHNINYFEPYRSKYTIIPLDMNNINSMVLELPSSESIN